MGESMYEVVTRRFLTDTNWVSQVEAKTDLGLKVSIN